MCYGRHTGYGGYGDWARGGRQILLDRQLLGGDVRTWVRLEDGSVSGNVHLNSTYGDDRYRLVEKRMTGQGNIHYSQLSPIFYIWVFFFSLFMAHRWFRCQKSWLGFIPSLLLPWMYGSLHATFFIFVFCFLVKLWAYPVNPVYEGQEIWGILIRIV
jgi:hypothetical protein